MTTCSIVIRTLNEEQHLGRLLSGIEQQHTQPDEVIIVDSGSDDSTLSIARAFGAKILHIARSEFSFGRALNLGFAAVQSDVGVAMSGHVYPVNRSYLSTLLRPFRDSNVGVAYGRQVGDKSSYYSEKRLMLQWFPPHGSGRQLTPFSNNANSATRVDIWRQLRFGEELTGLEDVEFCYRLMAMGKHIHYVAEAPVVHVHREPWNVIRNRYFREARTLVQIDPSQRLRAPSAFGLMAANVISDSLQAVRERVGPSDFTSIFKFRSAQFVGSWRGSNNLSAMAPDLKTHLYFPTLRHDSHSDASDETAIDYGEDSQDG